MKAEQGGEFCGGSAPELAEERKQRGSRGWDAPSTTCRRVRRLDVRRCELLEHLTIDTPVSPLAMRGKTAGAHHVVHSGPVYGETISSFGQADRCFLGPDRRHAAILSPARTRVVDGRKAAGLLLSEWVLLKGQPSGGDDHRRSGCGRRGDGRRHADRDRRPASSVCHAFPIRAMSAHSRVERSSAAVPAAGPKSRCRRKAPAEAARSAALDPVETNSAARHGAQRRRGERTSSSWPQHRCAGSSRAPSAFSSCRWCRSGVAWLVVIWLVVIWVVIWNGTRPQIGSYGRSSSAIVVARGQRRLTDQDRGWNWPGQSRAMPPWQDSRSCMRMRGRTLGW